MTGDGAALARIAAALERISPPPQPAPELGAAEAFVWMTGPDRLEPVARVARVDLRLLVGIDRARDTLLANTRQFAGGFPANNVLLWGARGMGKSSLVKAAHAEAARAAPGRLKLIELHREDLPSIGRLLALLRASELRFLLFCDDLSFDKDDSHYKSLKAVLDGGIEGRPDNVVLYATSNRRHLMPREMIENERQTGVNPSEATEEKVSLSRPVRALARLPRLLPGRLPGHDPRLLRRLRDRDRRRRAARRGDRVEPDPRGAVGAGGVAVRDRPRGAAGGAARPELLDGVLGRRGGADRAGAAAFGLEQQQRVVELLGQVRQAVHRGVDPELGQDVEHLGVVLGQVHRFRVRLLAACSGLCLVLRGRDA